MKRPLMLLFVLLAGACASGSRTALQPSAERVTVDAILRSAEITSLLNAQTDSIWLTSEFHTPGEAIRLRETTLHVQSDPGQWEPPPGVASIRRVVVVQAWADSAVVGIETSGWHFTRARGRVLFVAGQSWIFRRGRDGAWPYELYGQWMS